MIRRRSKRMAVAQLKERMDARFEAVNKRFEAVDKRFDEQRIQIDAGFGSMHDKLNAILRALNTRDDHQQQIVDEHEERLRDLEAWRRTTRDTVR
jgi:hypothetical protein